MFCNHCGKEIEATNNYCSFCNTRLFNTKDSKSISDIENYETNVGFSRPGSEYISPQVEYSKNEKNNLNTKDINSQIVANYSNYEDIKLQQEERQPGLLKKRKTFRKLLLGAFTVVVIAIGFIYSQEYFSVSKNYTTISNIAIKVHSDQYNETYIFNSKGDIIFRFPNGGETPYYTPDHRAAMLIGFQKSYYVNENELIPLRAGMNSFSLSDDGKYILYATSNEKNDNYLYLYDVDKQKEEVIDQIENKGYSLLNILPDGTITYITVDYNDTRADLKMQSFIIKNGEKPEFLGEDIIILAMSRDLQYLYYCEYKDGVFGAMYVRNKDEIQLLSSECNLNISFNVDCTEIMFTDNGYTYVSKKGGEKQKVSDVEFNFIITPKKCIVQKNSMIGITVYGIETFENKVILCNDSTLRLIGNEYQSKELSDGNVNKFANFVAISENGNDIMYGTTDSRIVKVSDLKGKCIQETYIDRAQTFVVSSDLSQVYYTDRNILFYVNKKGDITKIAEKVTDLCLNEVGDTAFFLQDKQDGKGTLYYSINGGMSKPVEDGYSVSGVQEWYNGVIFQKEVGNKFNTYYNAEGTDFKLLLEGVRLEQ